MVGLLQWLFEDASISVFEATGFYMSLISILFTGYSAKTLWSFKKKTKIKMKIPQVISSLEQYQKEMRKILTDKDQFESNMKEFNLLLSKVISLIDQSKPQLKTLIKDSNQLLLKPKKSKKAKETELMDFDKAFEQYEKVAYILNHLQHDVKDFVNE